MATNRYNPIASVGSNRYNPVSDVSSVPIKQQLIPLQNTPIKTQVETPLNAKQPTYSIPEDITVKVGNKNIVIPRYVNPSSVADNNLKLNQAPPLKGLDKFKETLSNFVEPATTLITGLNPRERAEGVFGTTLNTTFPTQQQYLPGVHKDSLIGLPLKAATIAESFVGNLVAAVPKTALVLLQTGKEFATLGNAKPVILPGKVQKLLGYEKPEFYGVGKDIATKFGELQTNENPNNNEFMSFFNFTRATVEKATGPVLDIMVTGQFVKMAAQGILNETTKSVVRKQTWEFFGQPESVASPEFETNYQILKQQFASDPIRSELIDRAYDFLRANGVPTMAERTAIPPMRKFLKQLISPVGATIPSESMVSPLNTANEKLPGTRPVPGQAHAMGLSMEEIEPVGYGQKAENDTLLGASAPEQAKDAVFILEHKYPDQNIVKKTIPSDAFNPISGQDTYLTEELQKYINEIKSGKQFPVVAENVGGKYEITDGIHRYLAYKELGITDIPTITNEIGVQDLGKTLKDLGLNENMTVEQMIEKMGKWNPGDRLKFDTALMEADPKAIKEILPNAPDAYLGSGFGAKAYDILLKEKLRVAQEIARSAALPPTTNNVLPLAIGLKAIPKQITNESSPLFKGTNSGRITLPPKEGYYISKDISGNDFYSKLDKGETLIPMKGLPDRPSNYSPNEWRILNEVDVPVTSDEAIFWRQEFKKVVDKLPALEKQGVIDKYNSIKAGGVSMQEEVNLLKDLVIKFRDKGGSLGEIIPSQVTKKPTIGEPKLPVGDSPIDYATDVYQTANNNLPPEIEIQPLQKIIQGDSSTPLNQQVGFLDYLKTPWRVFEQMGIRPEYQKLLTGYENYVRELPQNIDKITEWSKQVPKESNERIFRFLDGEKIALSQIESKVAEEVKVWLSEWADRLGMKPDDRISDYITHIFPLKAGVGIPEEISALINKKIPGSVYNPFLLQRQGAEGYLKDTWKALDAYVKRATRKVNMDPALASLKEATNQLTDVKQLNYLNRYIGAVNLRPTELDMAIDTAIHKSIGNLFGARPTASITRGIRQMITRSKLGGSIISFAKNLTQQVNTFAELGTFYTTKGYIDLVRFGGKELQENSVLMTPFIEDRTYSAIKKWAEKFDNVLFINMTASEFMNRGAAYYGAKAKFLKGKTTPKEFREAFGKVMPVGYKPALEDAITYGKFVAAKTQFLFGPLDTQVALNSDIAKTAFQFQTFGLKQTEFIANMVGQKDWWKLIRYLTASMLLFSYIGSQFGMKWDDSFKTFKFGAPPALTFAKDIWDAILGTKDQYGNTPSGSQRIRKVGSSLFTNVVPAGAQIKRSVEGFGAVNQGASYGNPSKANPRGAFQYKIDKTPMNYIRGTLFGKGNLEQAQKYYNKKSPAPSSSSRYNPI